MARPHSSSTQKLRVATRAHVTHGCARAFYHRTEERIQGPSAEDFIGTTTSSAQESYYSTAPMPAWKC
jgi:antirestriction protein ArdC